MGVGETVVLERAAGGVFMGGRRQTKRTRTEIICRLLRTVAIPCRKHAVFQSTQQSRICVLIEYSNRGLGFRAVVRTCYGSSGVVMLYRCSSFRGRRHSVRTNFTTSTTENTRGGKSV